MATMWHIFVALRIPAYVLLIILYWIYECLYFVSPGHAWVYVNHAELLSIVVGQPFICLSFTRDDIQRLRPREEVGRSACSLPTLSGGKHVLSPAVILSPVRLRNRPTSGGTGSQTVDRLIHLFTLGAINCWGQWKSFPNRSAHLIQNTFWHNLGNRNYNFSLNWRNMNTLFWINTYRYD